MKLSTVVDWEVKHQKQTMQPIIELDIWLLLKNFWIIPELRISRLTFHSILN